MMHQHLLEIKLDRDVVEFRGSDSECAGVVLTGSVVLCPTDTIKIKTLTLDFFGYTKVSWNTGSAASQKVHRQKKELIENHWTFISSKKGYLLEPGHHHYNFEIALPGDLPSSIKCEYGKVKYKFVATLDRPVFVLKKHAVAKLTIKRLPHLDSPLVSEPILIADMYKNLLNYEINSCNRFIGENHEIPIFINFMLMSEEYMLLRVECIFKEYLECKITGKTQLEIKNQPRIIAKFSKVFDETQKQEPVFEVNFSLCKGVEKATKNNVKNILCDCITPLISVTHKLKFCLTMFHLKTKKKEEFNVKTKIFIIPRSSEDILDELPRYESYQKNSTILGCSSTNSNNNSNNAISIPTRQNRMNSTISNNDNSRTSNAHPSLPSYNSMMNNRPI